VLQVGAKSPYQARRRPPCAKAHKPTNMRVVGYQSNSAWSFACSLPHLHPPPPKALPPSPHTPPLPARPADRLPRGPTGAGGLPGGRAGRVPVAVRRCVALQLHRLHGAQGPLGTPPAPRHRRPDDDGRGPGGEARARARAGNATPAADAQDLYAKASHRARPAINRSYCRLWEDCMMGMSR
jgi:hypothetical protein